MKIEEAIEILTKWRGEGFVEDEVKLSEAEQLGIEALKAIKIYRFFVKGLYFMTLPGETKKEKEVESEGSRGY